MMQQVIYLHGFLSSPHSEKARITREYFRDHCSEIPLYIPLLVGDIEAAISRIEAIINQQPATTKWRFIGSSLGGYLATLMVERHGGRAVLINPAVHPHRLMQHWCGEHKNFYTDEIVVVDQYSIAKMERLAIRSINDPSRFLVLLQTGDETLDYRDAECFYAGSQIKIQEGGNHAFEGYAQMLPTIIEFLSKH